MLLKTVCHTKLSFQAFFIDTLQGVLLINQGRTSHLSLTAKSRGALACFACLELILFLGIL